MADGWQYIGHGISNFLDGYNKSRDKRLDREIDEKRLKILVREAQRKDLSEGFTVGEDGSTIVDPSYYTEGTPAYQRANREAELKRSASGSAARSRMKAGEAQRLRNAFSAGTDLSPEDQNIEIDPGLVNLISPPKPMAGYDADQLEALGLISPEQAGKLKGVRLPTNAITALKPPPAAPQAGDSLVREYEGFFGAGSSKGLKPNEISGAVQREREANRRAGERARAAGTKDAEAKKQASKAKSMAKQTASIVSTDVNRALQMMRESEYAVGPWVGRTKAIPGTPAYNLDNLLDTIRANISFDKLQAMREASPTGGALGAVSDFENRLLQSTLGKLDVTMDPADFEYNLRRLQEQYDKVINEGIQPTGAGAENDRLNASQKRAAGAGKRNGSHAPDSYFKTEKKTITKKQYSPSRNQTKIIYSDGSEEIVSGKK